MAQADTDERGTYWWPRVHAEFVLGPGETVNRDQDPVGDLGPDGAHPALGIGVRCLRGGIFATWVPAPDSTASNARVNCPARSLTRNLNR